ncbi:helix-turn-helix transcriptional regulator [Nocardiopsis sp. CNT-189]|uniref:helix-turn-helix transcriptional regulator n=1 Tax=Nocardiopsis oceanisediminis TaxID=2816862 RepID=UPI003B3BBC15
MAPRDPGSTLTASQLAERWQCHVQSLANMRCRGAGPRWVKVGRLVRYRLADVEAYEEARAQGGEAA